MYRFISYIASCFVCSREEGDEKPKPPESQDDGYETSNSGEAARRKASSAEGSPAAPRSPAAAPAYEPLLARFPEPPAPAGFRYDAPPQPDPEPYQHFPFPKYPEPYYKREPDAPYDMSQQHGHGGMHFAPHTPHTPHTPHKRDEDAYDAVKRECDDPYSFVEDEAMCAMLGQPPPHLAHELAHLHPHAHAHAHTHPHQLQHAHQLMLGQPKKRGRKKKIKDENG